MSGLKPEARSLKPAPDTDAAHVVVAAVTTTIAFWTYTHTLLPGVDLGDTGGLQAAVLWPEVSARQAYPFYYFLAKPFVLATAPHHPAIALNLFSAVCAGLAVGLLTWVTAAVSRSVAGGAVAGLLLLFSYTFWHQAIIAEVYALHLMLVGMCLVALLAYERRRTRARLAAFFVMYALSFGNHLSMILLLVPFAVFLLMTMSRPSELFRPSTVRMALLIAGAGALQYLPNLVALWRDLDSPERWTDKLAAFWFDTTKADWRELMVLGVGPDQTLDHLAMFFFDLRQQFGISGVLLAFAGAVALWRTRRPWGALVVLAYGINTMFALTYNVGDPHVFFLPGHYFVALAAGYGVATVVRMRRGGAARAVAIVATLAAIGYIGWRAYDTWPVADRHADRRGEQLAERLLFGLDERRDLLVTQLDWQVENAILYRTRYHTRHVVWIRLPDVMLHFPFLVRDNQAIGRDIVLTPGAAAQVAEAFGPLFPLAIDDTLPTPTLASVAARIPRGAPYVLALLTPPREEQLDPEMFGAALIQLAGGRPPARDPSVYEVVAGLAGEAPTYYRSAARPFRERISLEDATLDVRMESWLPTETFRRGGFGHVVRNHRHVAALERGVNLVWFDGRGEPSTPFYAAGLYAPQPRLRLLAEGAPSVARLARHKQ
jgi:hypothetical protein